MKRARPNKKPLPSFVTPMLAKAGTAFDSPDYLFEVKWDGTRALAFIEGGRYKLLNRRQANLTARYPEFDALKQFPEGTILDGEIVVFKEGKPDFGQLMSREQARSLLKVQFLTRSTPATYMVFDLLYYQHESWMHHPFTARRNQLAALLKEQGASNIVMSQTMPGEHGLAFFEEIARRELEGVIAKRAASRYAPGGRSDNWIKIKRSAMADFAILGFEPELSGKRDFRSLIIATTRDGKLVCVGKVGTGFDMKLRAKLNDLLWKRLRPRPLISCKIRGNWVEPGLYCQVKYLELTPNGELRGPAFIKLIEGS